jgi:hypothetical protein
MDYEELVDEVLARHGDAQRSQMMGMPCVKHNGKIVLGFSDREQAAVFKLPDPIAHGEALKLSGAHLFRPGGGDRPFKEWVVIPPEHADEWTRFAELAFAPPHGST